MAVPFNAGDYLVDRHVREGHGDRVAVRAPGATLTYAELAHQVRRVEAGLHALGVRPEERVALVMVDGVELLSGILAAMRMGAVAMPVSTMLRAGELGKLLADSRARTVLVSDELAETVDAARDIAYEVTTVVHRADWDQFLAAGTDPPPYEAWEDSPALWLYTSGTTGEPKGAMHRHASMREVAETYAKGVLGIRPDDRCLSVAKLFFAYGLGNSATCRRTPSRRYAWRSPRARRCRRRCTSGSWTASACTSSTASARPRPCTSSCPTARAPCGPAPRAYPCRATRSSCVTTPARSSNRPGRRVTCSSPADPSPPGTGAEPRAPAARSRASGYAPGTPTCATTTAATAAWAGPTT